MPLDFIIDKITHSIECKLTGARFETRIISLRKEDLKFVSKRSGWNFLWRAELNNPEKEVYKLLIEENPVIQGLISLAIKEDHIVMELIESAPHNIGENKQYLGVAGNLVAYACYVSFNKGFEGNVAFIAKTSLINHYEASLGAIHIGHQRMIIETEAAWKLVKQYYK